MNPNRLIVALIAALLLPIALPIAASSEETPGGKVVVHLGHYTDDLHAASMGMSLARLLQKNGAKVTVFLDREGVRLADARGPRDLRWGASKESVHSIFEGFVEAGGSALLCSHCAQAAGIGPDDLLAGARIASDNDVAALFLGADRVIDY